MFTFVSVPVISPANTSLPCASTMLNVPYTAVEVWIVKDSLVGFGYKVTSVMLPSSIPTVNVKFKVIVLSHPAAFVKVCVYVPDCV